MPETDNSEKQHVYKSTERARKRRRRSRLTWVVIIALLIIGGAGFGYYKFIYLPNQTTEIAQETELQTAIVQFGDLVIFASGVGDLVPAQEINLAFPVNSEVTAVNVKVGDYVDEGQVLVVIDPKNLYVAYEKALRSFNEFISPTSLTEAEQKVIELEDQISSAVNTLSWLISPNMYFYENKLAEAQDDLNDAQAANDEDAIFEAEESIAKAEAGIQWAAYDYTETYGPDAFAEEICEMQGRTQVCETEITYPSQAEINDARFELKVAQAKLQEAQNEFTLLTTGELPEGATGSLINSYLAAKETLETAQENMEKTELIAPFSGLVTSVEVQVGDETETRNLISMIDNSKLYLDISIDGSDWQQLVVGYPVEVTFNTYPDTIFTGSVIQVDPMLTNSAGATIIQGRVELDDANSDILQRLPIGSSADVDVISGKAENVLLVPVEALKPVSDNTYSVFLVINGELELRMVEIGLVDVYYAEVISGLEKGDVVSTGIVETE